MTTDMPKNFNFLSFAGALVSAGFEVSATVRRTQELDEAFITPTQMDLNQPTYNSIRTVERYICF